jgi:hypothetical protein
MSAAHDGHADHDAGHHDASHHDHFDNDPVTELPADEPRTPSWIPILGLTLFFLAGTAFLVMGRGDDEAKAENAPAAAHAAPQQAAPPPNPGVQLIPQPAQPTRPAPAPAGSAGGLRPLSPEQAQAIQKQIDALREQQQRGQGPKGAQPQGAPPAAPRKQ